MSEQPLRFVVNVEPIGAHAHAVVFAGRGTVANVWTLVLRPEEAALLKRRLEWTELDGGEGSAPSGASLGFGYDQEESAR